MIRLIAVLFLAAFVAACGPSKGSLNPQSPYINHSPTGD